MKRNLPIYNLFVGLFLTLLIQGCSKQNELEQLGLEDKSNSSIILITSPTAVDVLDVNRIARIVTVKGAVIGAGLTSLSYTLDAGATTVEVPSFDGSSPDYSFDIDFGDFTEGTLNDVSLKLIAKDAAGVEVSETLAFKVQMNAYENPTVTIISPTVSDEFLIADNIPSGLTGIANTAITIMGTIFSQGTSTYTYDIGNGPQPLTVVDNAFSQEILLSNVADKEAKDITLTITATDEASQSGSGSVTFSANRWDIGSTKTESFTYDGAAVTYTIVRARDGEIWLQQNLGSNQVAASLFDAASFGDYFQYGRWNDGGEKMGSPVKLAKDLGTKNNPTGAIANLFITQESASPTRWWHAGSATDTWTAATPAAVTATNGCDPCKVMAEGWRLATKEELEAMITAEEIVSIETAFSSTLKLPSGGFRNVTSTGGLAGATATNKTSFYRSNTPGPTGANSYMLDLRAITTDGVAVPTAKVASNLRNYGAFIRCIKKD